MKIIWVINGVTSDAASALKKNYSQNITWIENMLQRLKGKMSIVVCCPVTDSRTLTEGVKDGVRYYGIPRKRWRGDRYEPDMGRFYKEVFRKEAPDVIHIWGTELPHTYSAVLAAEECGMLDCTVASIQGLVSVIETHFMAAVPLWVQYVMLPKNFIRGFNLKQTQLSYRKRGQYEKKALRKLRHVIGRTDWDKACTLQMNPELHYHKNNESLREIFYQQKWEWEKCDPFRIFLSQGNVPLKGMHFVLDAMWLLKEKYPAIQLYVTGRNVLGKLSLKQKLALNPYDWFIRREIAKKGLEGKVTFLGSLSGEEMCEQYRKANVFVLASSIENSPNSLGEAMLLGVPAVASDVGGVSSLANPNEVSLYPYDEPYMLAHYISRIFDDPAAAFEMARKAREHALITHDAEDNEKSLLRIYAQLGSKRSAASKLRQKTN